MLITKGTGGLKVRGEVPPGKKGSARLILTVYSCRCSRTGLSGSQGRSSSCQHGREHFGLCWQCNAPAGEKWHFVQLVLKKKKRERENASLLCKGLRLHRTIRSQILSCSTSVRLFMNLSLTLFLTGRTRTVFFFPAWVKKKKKESSDSLPIAEEKPFVLMEQGVWSLRWPKADSQHFAIHAIAAAVAVLMC